MLRNINDAKIRVRKIVIIKLMFNSQPTENELLKTILEPLLEDFTYWFSRSRLLLESERLSFLSVEEQNDLLERVKNAQQEVATSHLLFKTTGGQVGIEARMLLPWHHLVAECWGISNRRRTLQGWGEYQSPKTDA
jgi:hypothetical protein